MILNFQSSGSYIYDMNGKTIGIKKGSSAERDAQNRIYPEDVCQDSYRTGYMGDDVHLKDEFGNEWILFDASYDTDDIARIEDLDVNTIITMFLNGDLVFDELKKGLEAKGVNDIKKEWENHSSGNHDIKVTFTYNDKSVSLICSENAASSQLDTNSYIDGEKYQETVDQSYIDGLKSRGASDIDIEEFFDVTGEDTNGNKTYRVKVSAGSSLADIENRISVTNSGNAPQYDEPDVDFAGVHCPSINYGGEGLTLPIEGNLWAAQDYRINYETYEKIKFMLSDEQIAQLKSGTERWGQDEHGNPVLAYDWKDYLTEEQKAYINNHPEIFDMCFASDGGYGYNDARKLEMLMSEPDYAGLSHLHDPETWYASYLRRFSEDCTLNSQKDTYDWNNGFKNPAAYVQFNADDKTVEFTENTIKIIKQFLDRQKYLLNEGLDGYQDSHRYMAMFGLSVDDTEEEIIAKVKQFISKNGGDPESMKMDFVKYYNKMAEVDTTNQLLTYSQIRNTLDNLTDAVAQLDSIWESGNATDYQSGTTGINSIMQVKLDDYGNVIGSHWVDAGWGDNGRDSGLVGINGSLGSQLGSNGYASGVEQSIDSGRTSGARQTSSGSNTSTSAQITTHKFSLDNIEVSEDAARAAKEEKLKAFAAEIEACTGNGGYTPIHTVDLDENGNVVFGNNFIRAMQIALRNWESNSTIHGGNNGDAATWMQIGYNRQFLEMLGINIPSDFLKAHETLLEYADNEDKLISAIEKFCKSLGSTDGKTVSLEAYYDALAKYDVRNFPYRQNDEHISHNQSYRDYYTEENFVEMTSIYDRIDKAQEAWCAENPEIEHVIEPFINMMKTTGTNGKIRLEVYGNKIRVVDYMGYYTQTLDDTIQKAFYTAAGVKEGDSIKTQTAKLANFIKQFGNAGTYRDEDFYCVYDIDGLEFLSYMLGDNARNTNYLLQARLDYIKDAENADKKASDSNTVTVSIDEYNARVKNEAAKSGLIYDNKSNTYYKYDSLTRTKYNYIWDPIKNKWLMYTDAQLSEKETDDKINQNLIRIKIIIAALMQNLNFTADLEICCDKNGNYYDYNEITGKFEKRA